MTASISIHELATDAPALFERLAAHPEGVVVSYEGSDVARLVPLSAEERAWRDALLSEGVDPDEDLSTVAPAEPLLEPAEPILDSELTSIEVAYAESAPDASEPAPDPVPDPVPDPDELPVEDPDEEPAPEPDPPYDPDPLEALTPRAFPVESGHHTA